MSWEVANDRVKRTFARVGEPLAITLASGNTLCTHGRITSSDEDVAVEDGVMVRSVLALQLSWSDATQLTEADVVERSNVSTRHGVIVVRKINDANGRVLLQAAS